MVTVDITVNDEGLEKALLYKAGRLNKEIQNLSKDLVDIAFKWVQREAPRRTGRLKSSGIEHGYTGSGGYVFASKAKVPYMDYVIDGTRPHMIIPKSRQALFWPGANHPVRKIKHPGQKSNPFVDRAADSMMGEIERRISNFENWLEEV